MLIVTIVTVESGRLCEFTTVSMPAAHQDKAFIQNANSEKGVPSLREGS